MGLKALVVAGSAGFRDVVGTVLAEYPAVSRVEFAVTGAEGLRQAGRLRPDLVCLARELPDLAGSALLARVRASFPNLTAVVVTGQSPAGVDPTLLALSRGAAQPLIRSSRAARESTLAAVRAELEPVIRRLVLPTIRRYWVVAIAVSTGGPDALGRVIPKLPAGFPLPVLVVQHMPAGFTRTLADSLDTRSRVRVHEGTEGQALQAGHVYIAPGGCHMVVHGRGGRAIIGLNDDPPEQSVRPAADVLFRSLSLIPARTGVLSVVMTGMGEDGLAGVRRLYRTGTYCLTQSAESCVVYGMPRAVDLAGLSHESVDLDRIAFRLTSLAGPCRVVLPT